MRRLQRLGPRLGKCKLWTHLLLTRWSVQSQSLSANLLLKLAVQSPLMTRQHHESPIHSSPHLLPSSHCPLCWGRLVFWRGPWNIKSCSMAAQQAWRIPASMAHFTGKNTNFFLGAHFQAVSIEPGIGGPHQLHQ